MIKGYEKVLEKAGILDRPAEKPGHWLGMGRKEEFEKVHEKYPEIPKTLLLKTDMVRRGVNPTLRAIQEMQKSHYSHTANLLFQFHQKDHTEDYAVPTDFHFNDLTQLRFTLSPPENDPYTIDFIDGKMWVVSDGERLEEAVFRKRSPFFGKKTSAGQPMQTIIDPQSSGHWAMVCANRHCGMWNTGDQCRFCDMDYNTRLQMKMGRGFTVRPTYEDVYESMCEWLKENRRFLHVFLNGGSDPKRGYDREFEYTLSLVKAINKAGRDVLNEERFPLNILMSPLKEEQMIQLRDAGLSAVCLQIEAWPKERFEIICPGKNKLIGWDTFISRTINAVEIFGKGHVCAGGVMCEMAPPPYGVGVDGDIDEAVGMSLDHVDFWLSHDIVHIEGNFYIEPGSFFYKIGAQIPPLEFLARSGLGRFNLYKLKGDLNIFQLCYSGQFWGTYCDWLRYL